MQNALLCLMLMQPLPGDEFPRLENQLSSDSYEVRKQAERCLARSNSLELCRRLAKSKNPEVRLRASHRYQVLREKTLNDLQPYPRLCALWYDPDKGCYNTKDNPYRDAQWIKHLGPLFHSMERINFLAVTYGWVSDNDCYREGTKRWLNDLLVSGVSVRHVKAMVSEMRRRDQIYYNSCNVQYHFRP